MAGEMSLSVPQLMQRGGRIEGPFPFTKGQYSGELVLRAELTDFYPNSLPQSPLGARPPLVPRPPTVISPPLWQPRPPVLPPPTAGPFVYGPQVASTHVHIGASLAEGTVPVVVNS